MKRTLFNTPIITPVVRVVSNIILRMFGWEVVGKRYAHTKKYVGIAAPHTSNWDFVIFLLTAFALGVNSHWMGKHTLFRFPIVRSLFLWLGGIPVNRTIRGDMVAKTTEMFRTNDVFAVGISPEGTRKPVSNWHKGFWYIAQNANVPIMLAFIDYKTRWCGIHGVFYSSGDVEADMLRIKKFYTQFVAKNPHNFRT